jgi:hypothetical protein
MYGTVFQLGQPPARLSKNDLIQNKLASGREQDILDVKKLQAAGREDPSNR